VRNKEVTFVRDDTYDYGSKKVNANDNKAFGERVALAA